MCGYGPSIFCGPYENLFRFFFLPNFATETLRVSIFNLLPFVLNSANHFFQLSDVQRSVEVPNSRASMRIRPNPQHCLISETLLSLALFTAEAQSVTAELNRDRTRDAQAQAHQVKYQHLGFFFILSWSLYELAFIRRTPLKIVKWSKSSVRCLLYLVLYFLYISVGKVDV